MKAALSILLSFAVCLLPLSVFTTENSNYRDYVTYLTDIYGDTQTGGVDNTYGDYLLASNKKRISLDLEEAQLVDVVKMLSQETDLNFVSTEAVKERRLTSYLADVPLKEALDILFKANNLHYEYYPEANIFVVKEMGKPTMELISKVYRLKYVRVKSSPMEREIANKMQIVELGLQTAQAGAGGAGGATGAAATGAGATGGGGAIAGLDPKEIGIKRAVEKVLTEFGKVVEDPITNSLIVVDVPSQFPIIEEVIKNLDVPTPKVMIEVEMLDVAKQTVDKLGMDWPEALASLTVSGTRETRFPFGGTGTPGWGRSIDPDDNTFGGGWDFGAWSAERFGPTILTVIGAQLIFNFLSTQTDTKFLARPKILTVSNETAEIKIVTNEAIGVTKTVTPEGRETFSVERSETGNKLRVTPQVDSGTGEITLFVEAISAVAANSGFAAGTGALITGTIKNPEQRSAKAVARLKAGQTLLLGGLIKNEVTDIHEKVPILGDIPFLGRFFSWDHKNHQDRELLVFLTPHIIEDKPMPLLKASSISREQNALGAASVRRESVGLALDNLSR